MDEVECIRQSFWKKFLTPRVRLLCYPCGAERASKLGDKTSTTLQNWSFISARPATTTRSMMKLLPALPCLLGTMLPQRRPCQGPRASLALAPHRHGSPHLLCQMRWRLRSAVSLSWSTFQIAICRLPEFTSAANTRMKPSPSKNHYEQTS